MTDLRLSAERSAELVRDRRIAEEEVHEGVVRPVEIQRLVAVGIEGVEEPAGRLPHGTCTRYHDAHRAGPAGGGRAAEIARNREAFMLCAARFRRHGRPRPSVSE